MDDRFVNLGEEVILTLLWQSGASESVIVCFVISLSICYWLFKCGVLRVVFVCVRERVTSQHRVCVCACVWERERERGSQRSISCVCVCERGRHGHITTVACVQTHTGIITVSVTRLCSSLGLELMVKLRTLLTVFTLILKAEARDYGKGRYISNVRPITMFWVSWPIRAVLVGRRDFVENKAFERGGA